MKERKSHCYLKMDFKDDPHCGHLHVISGCNKRIQTVYENYPNPILKRRSYSVSLEVPIHIILFPREIFNSSAP